MSRPAWRGRRRWTAARTAAARGLGATALAAALLAGPRPAAAGESVFSLQFLGLRTESSDPRARGMGSLGIALDDAQTTMTLNPASTAALRSMTLSLMGGGTWRTSRDATLEESQGHTSFPQLRAALPITRTLVLSLGAMTLRNYRSGFALPPSSVAGIGYHYEFEREGSLYEFPLGLAAAISPRLHVGATLDIVMGTVDESWTVQSDSLVAFSTRRRDGFGGTGVTLGVVGRPLGPLRVGVSWTPGVRLDLDARTTIEDARLGTVSIVRDTIVTGTVGMPGAIRLGAAIDISLEWLATADWLYRDWEGFDGRLYGAESLGGESRLGGGLEYHPHTGKDPGRVAYRLGLSRSTWPQRLGGEPVDETTVHAGTGFRLRGDAGRLDVALEYTRAGSLERNGYEESRWSVWVGLNGQETWRRKSPRTR
jgi:hypothetical protein